MKKAKTELLNDELNTLTAAEIAETNELQQALELINKEHIISMPEALEQKKFVVKKNEEIKSLTRDEMENKEDYELDEISNQADQAFYDLMDIAINCQGAKGCGDIASAAQSFLNIKLNAKLQKAELKLKKAKQELDKKKLEMSASKSNSEDEDIIVNSDDNIIVLDRTASR